MRSLLRCRLRADQESTSPPRRCRSTSGWFTIYLVLCAARDHCNVASAGSISDHRRHNIQRVSRTRMVLADSDHSTAFWYLPTHAPLPVVISPRRDTHVGGYCCDHALLCRGGGGMNSSRLVGPFIGNKRNCWLVLFLAIFIDSYTATLMKIAQDEGSLRKLVLSYIGYFLSMFGFGLSLNGLDISIAYAVWAALGTAIVSTVGILKFKEGFDATKLLCLAMIVVGVVGLNLRELKTH